MVAFLRENWGNIVVLAVVFAVAAVMVVNMVKRKRAGKSGCGCGCSNCPSNGICHPKAE